MQHLPLRFDIGRDVQADLEGYRFERPQHQRTHKRIERATREGLTPRTPYSAALRPQL